MICNKRTIFKNFFFLLIILRAINLNYRWLANLPSSYHSRCSAQSVMDTTVLGLFIKNVYSNKEIGQGWKCKKIELWTRIPVHYCGWAMEVLYSLFMCAYFTRVFPNNIFNNFVDFFWNIFACSRQMTLEFVVPSTSPGLI